MRPPPSRSASFSHSVFSRGISFRPAPGPGRGGVYMPQHERGDTARGGHMSRTPRIPKAEITGLYGYMLKRFSRKLVGDVPEPAEVMWHNRPVLTSVYGLGRKAEKWN